MPAWATRSYCVQASAAFTSGVGNAGAVVAGTFAVLATGGSGSDAGVVAGSRVLLAMIFVLYGGAIADGMSRPKVMVRANTVNALSQGTFGALVIFGEAQLWQMVVCSGVGGICQAFYVPASEGMILGSVPYADSGRAFAVFRAVLNSAQVVGAAIGGLLVVAAGPGWVLVFDAVCFVAAAALRAFLPPEVAVRRGGATLARQLQEGWTEFRSRRWLWVVVISFGVINGIVNGVQTVVGPIVSERSMGGPGAWGLALAAFGAGTLTGALFMYVWRPRRMLVTGMSGAALLALPSAALAFSSSSSVVACAMLAAGIGLEVFSVNWMMVMNQEIPRDRMARITSYDWMGSYSLVPLGTVIAGPAMESVGPGPVLCIAAGSISILCLLALLVPDVRNLSRRDHEGQ
ncbi:MFS transporter [Embleya sp. NBC_00888]|nr:MFS transporter [Embleya sp. NBC_00888]